MNAEPVTIEDARLIFRNFAGRESEYNREGDRNFGVVLPMDIAKVMEEDGWNIKYLKPREEDEEPLPWVQVSVSFKRRPPRVVMVTSRGRTTLPEELLEALDYADIASVDLILNPYNWVVSGRSGVKAYLKSLFVTIQEDELELKYSELPEIDIYGNQKAIEAGQDPNVIEAEIVDDDIKAIEA